MNESKIKTTWFGNFVLEMVPGCHLRYDGFALCTKPKDPQSLVGKAYTLVEQKNAVTCRECIELMYA